MDTLSSKMFNSIFIALSFLFVQVLGETICYEKRSTSTDKQLTCPEKCCGTYEKRSCCQNNNNAVIIGVVIGGVLLFILIVTIIVCCCKKKNKTKIKRMRQGETSHAFGDQHAMRVVPPPGYQAGPPQYHDPPGYVLATQQSGAFVQQTPQTSHQIMPGSFDMQAGRSTDTMPPGYSGDYAGPLPPKY